ncbi:MAG TPA: SIS domain-containing protein [Haloplasmataceae bacterium]
MIGLTKEYFEKQKSIYTITEILQQPNTWSKTYEIIRSFKKDIQKFMSQFDDKTVIYLSGAGTSEFVGNTIVSYINDLGRYNVKSVSTTDIVLEPKKYFHMGKKTLVVSFGRSGSSPESVATVNFANQLCDDIYHLIVTCNKNGELAQSAKNNSNYFLITLPEETHDKSFAMTSSYTNMMLATILVFDIDNIEKYQDFLNDIVFLGNKLINANYTLIDDLTTEFPFSRIIYLGTGSNKGMAQESALKMLELTAGKIPTLYDSPLGFRHGPKSIICEKALTVLFMSDDEYTRKYELDLLKEMLHEKEGNELLVISNRPLGEKLIGLNYQLEFNYPKTLNNMALVFPYIILAQLLALKKAIQLGISCDNPCPKGTVNRVVKGVRIYNI